MKYWKALAIAMEFLPQLIALVRAVQEKFLEASGEEKAAVVKNVLVAAESSIQQIPSEEV